jgi:LDH2 family malate/lactate/ureidoglycolate dehydrogenase
MNVSAERIRQQIAAILSAWGMDADLVRSTTEVMVETDLAGIDSHEPIGSSGALAAAPCLIPGAD